MPPPTGPIPIAQKAPMPPKRGHQPPKALEKRRHSPSTTGKKTLQERQKGKPLKLKVCTVAKMHTGPVKAHHAQKLAKLTSTVVPLQRLKIQDDTLMEVPKSKLEAKTPTTPPK